MAPIVELSAAVPLAALSNTKITGSRGLVSVKAFDRLNPFSGRSEWQRKTIVNGIRVCCMQVWNPNNNLKFETLSYLPPMSQDALARQIDYLISTGCAPCLEFDVQGTVTRANSNMPGYYDGRYWTMWKLPMFGCTDSASVLREIEECKKLYGDKCYIRCMGFDMIKQVQRASFIVHKP